MTLSNDFEQKQSGRPPRRPWKSRLLTAKAALVKGRGRLARIGLAAALCVLAGWQPAALAQDTPGPAADVPRIAVMSAFEPELTRLLARTTDRKTFASGGVTFTSGLLDGHPVVLFLSGISMVNAAAATQNAADHFRLRAILFSGIAGGVDPGLAVGDVVVPEQWGQYLENVLARQTPEGWRLPGGKAAEFDNFGMMFPRGVQVPAPDGPRRQFWFKADPALLDVARRAAAGMTLSPCAGETACLTHRPRVVVGGNGVSGQSFVDNADFRAWAFRTFQARVLDMESAAVAQVAQANGVPVLVFRSLSDLAGGGPGENEMHTFLTLAADNSAQVLEAFLKALPPDPPDPPAP